MPDTRPGVPPFVAVYDRLRELVRRDELTPGEQLPSEVVLAGELSVGRELVHEALLLLEEDGFLVRDRERRWVVAPPADPTSFTDPFARLLSGELRAVRRLHAAVESGSSWSRELLASDGPFLVWETVLAHGEVLLASTLEVMVATAAPAGLTDADHNDVERWPTLLDAVDPGQRAAMTTELWRLTPVSTYTERLSWMDLPMHGIPASLTVVLAEAGTPAYLAKNLFDLGSFNLTVG